MSINKEQSSFNVTPTQTPKFKKLLDMNLKFQKQTAWLDEFEREASSDILKLEQIPNLLHEMAEGTKPNEKIHAAYLLKSMSEDKKFRKPMALMRGFLEKITSLLLRENEEYSHLRCQQHILSIITNLLLEDPVIDSYIANEEHMLPGIVKMLYKTDKTTQELVAKTLDYLSVSPENRTLICTADGILAGIVNLLEQTTSNVAREHVLTAVLYLSKIPENRFCLARQKGMIEEIKNSLYAKEPKIISNAITIVYNLCLLKENIPIIAKNKSLIKKIKYIYEKTTIFDDNTSGLKKDDEIIQLCGRIIELENIYASRVNSKIILNRDGFYRDIIPIKGSNDVCRSLISTPRPKELFYSPRVQKEEKTKEEIPKEEIPKEEITKTDPTEEEIKRQITKEINDSSDIQNFSISPIPNAERLNFDQSPNMESFDVMSPQQYENIEIQL